MAFNKFDDQSKTDFPPRQMFKGDWECADCGKKITELPFQPSPGRPIYCLDCWKKRFGNRPKANFSSRQTFKGSWVCAGCGKEITELPFQPSPDRPIYCRDCWAKNKEQK